MEHPRMNVHAPVREIVVAATEEALNTAITENQIQPEKIISVILQPAKHLAVGDYEAKYRVLYRL
jgi:chorismate mutase